MLPIYNPTPLSLKYPDNDSEKTLFIATRGYAPTGSGGGVENNSRHAWFFWINEKATELQTVTSKTSSSSSDARQILQLERHGSQYVYLEPNVVLPIASSPYPFASNEAYGSASYYTPIYNGSDSQMTMNGTSRSKSTGDSELSTKGGSFDEDLEPESDQIYSLGCFSRDERERILTLAADIDINPYLHGKGDQYGRGNDWSHGSGISVGKSTSGSSGTSDDGSDDSYAPSDLQLWRVDQQYSRHRASGSNGSGMVNGSRVWARELLGKMVEEGLIDRDTFLKVVEMVPLPR